MDTVTISVKESIQEIFIFCACKDTEWGINFLQ